MRVKHIISMEKNCWKEAEVALGAKGTDTLELTGEQKQTVLGFGGCFNELGWEALQLLQEDVRRAFIRELYTEEGCHFTYGRVPIGANDFSLEWYSCDETPEDYELKDFSIQRDKIYTLPYIKEAMVWQPDLELFASPWSPPIWMKTKKAYNYGTLRMEEAVLRAYARYFARFVQAYKEEGVRVAQIHVQNEPMADQKFPSCKWTGEEMRDFIKNYLGPEFAAQGMDTQIWLGTINGPFTDFMMPGFSAPFSEFYDQFINTVLSDPEARKYISGVGLQWGGKHVIEQVSLSYPELHLMNTESECGDGKNTWEHMEYIFRQMWIYFKHGAERYTYWNMALQNGGISTWGWTQNSLCTVDPEQKTLTLQPEFYLMKHFSHFVQPGAKYLETRGHWCANCLAFENPDGSIVLQVGSNMNNDREFTFCHKGESFTAVIPAHSIHTFVITE